MERINFFTTLIITASLFIVGCSETDPHSTDDEHFKPYGFELISSGVTKLKVFKGVIDPSFPESILVYEGAETDHLEIIFFDESGNKIGVPKDSDTKLGWNIADTGIAKLSRHDNEEWEFHIKGIKQGSTTIELLVMHVDHADFRSPKIPINVVKVEIAEPSSYKLIDEESSEQLAIYNSDGSVEGEIILEINKETDHIVIHFFDEKGEKVIIPSPPYSLKLEFTDNSIAEITGRELDEPWAFKIKSLKFGSTSLKVCILFEGNIKYSFLGEIPIKVQ